MFIYVSDHVHIHHLLTIQLSFILLFFHMLELLNMFDNNIVSINVNYVLVLDYLFVDMISDLILVT